MAAGAGLVAPLFTRYLEILGASPTVIGAIMAIDWFILSYGLFGGYLADRLGRKKFIVFTHYFFAFALLFFVFARHWVFAVIGLLLLGVRVAAKPALDAVMADATLLEERGRIYSLSWVAMTVMTSVSALVMSLMVKATGLYQGTRLGFFIYFILALSIATLFWKKLRETYKPISQSRINIKEFFTKIKEVTISKSLKLFMVYNLLHVPARCFINTYYCFINTYYVLYLVHVSSVSDSMAAVVFSLANWIYLFAQLLLGPLADKLNRNLILLVLTLITLAANLSLLAFHQKASLAMSSCVFILSALSLSQYLHGVIYADLTPQENRATVLGFISTVVAVEGALTQVIGGRLFELNHHYPFTFSVLSLLASALVLKKSLFLNISK